MSDSNNTQSPAKPIPMALRLVYTLIPFVVYLLSLQFSLPTKTTLIGNDPPDWSKSNHLLAVGITPWLIAAVMVEIFGRILPNWKRLSLQGETGYADLRRVMNIIGVIFAIIHAGWITFDLTYVPSVMMAPPEEFYFPSQNEASPLTVFAMLLMGAVGFKILIDSCIPHSLLHKRGWIVAVPLLLATFATIVRQSSNLPIFVNGQDILRIAVTVLSCGMLLSFILMKPPFVWGPKTTSH